MNYPENFLHVAPEPILERRFRKIFKTGYLTSDLFSPDVDVKMDITDIQYPDGTFDFIYCSHVLEHVAEDRKAMAELARVLKTGGTGIFLVPITVDVTVEDESIVSPEERLKHYGQEDHVRRYGNDYIDRLRSAGFVVSKIEPKDFLSAEEIQNMGITKASGDIFSCTL